jgi:hypothetical protein
MDIVCAMTDLLGQSKVLEAVCTLCDLSSNALHKVLAAAKVRMHMNSTPNMSR